MEEDSCFPHPAQHSIILHAKPLSDLMSSSFQLQINSIKRPQNNFLKHFNVFQSLR